MLAKNINVIFFLSNVIYVMSYNNGLAQLPAMGWNTWCTTGLCEFDVCNEEEIHEIGHAIINNGMYDLGYNYVNLDDCWESCSRSSNGSIMADETRFPSGIPNLTNYLHSLNLKSGIYTSAGTRTCNKGNRTCSVPGSYGHYQQDANTFANWNVDYVKLDWCGTNPNSSQIEHTEFSQYLNQTNRHIWLHLDQGYIYPPPAYVAQVSNSWKIYMDHHDNWESTVVQIQTMANTTSMSTTYNWGMTDFLTTGGQGCNNNEIPNTTHPHCPGQTDIEYMTEFSIFAIGCSPLIVATDIRNMTDIMKNVLLNKEIIDINQQNDTPAGKRINSINCESSSGILNACQIWSRQLNDTTSSMAVVLLNIGNDTHTFGIDFDQLSMNWTNDTKVNIRDLWLHKDLGTFQAKFESVVQPHGVVFTKMSQT